MKLIKPVLFILFLMGVGVTQASTQEINYTRQMESIVLFYEMLTEEAPPSLEGFFRLFGHHNESELKMILNLECPPLSLEDVNKILNNPGMRASRFLGCIKSTEPELSDAKIERQIVFPPRKRNDFTEFIVISSGKKIIFQFSQDETVIENIYLPGGKSIYDLIDTCIRRDRKNM